MLTIPQDPAYKRSMTYRAVPLAALLPAVAPNATVRFIADDGFAVSQFAAPLLINPALGATGRAAQRGCRRVADGKQLMDAIE